MKDTILKKEKLKETIKNLTDMGVPEFVGVVTFLLGVIIFAVRTCIYCYERGRFSVFGINPIYIEVESPRILYSFFMYMGIAIMILISNAFFYLCIKKKHGVIGLFAVIVEFIVILTVNGMAVGKTFLQLIPLFDESIHETIQVFKEVLAIELLINLYSIVFAITDWLLVKWKLFNKNEGRPPISIYCLVFLIQMMVFPALAFTYGKQDASEQRNFRVIVQPVSEKQEILSDTYFNYEEGKVAQIMVVLHETTDEYIATYLYNRNDRVELEYDWQITIAKEDVESKYLDDIYAINKQIGNIMITGQ